MWYKTVPPPVAVDKSYWYDYRIGKTFEGAPGNYTAFDSTISGLMFAESFELVTPPNYMLPDTTIYADILNAWVGNGVENSLTTISVDFDASFAGVLPNGGAMADSFSYRAHNDQGASDIRTIGFTTQYTKTAEQQAMNLAAFLSSGGTLSTRLSGVSGWLDPQYTVQLVIEEAGFNEYLLTMKVVDAATGAEVKVANINNQILDDKWRLKQVDAEFFDADGYRIELNKTGYISGTPIEYTILQLSNGQEDFSQSLSGSMSYEQLQSIRSFRLKQPLFYCYDIPYDARGYRAECWD
jgi:hypothetical protein